MSEKELKYLKFSRRYIRGKITKKFIALTSDVINNSDLKECKTYLGEIGDLKEEIKASNKEVANLIWRHTEDEAVLNQEMEDVDSYNQKLTALHNSLDDRVSELTRVISDSPDQPSHSGGFISDHSRISNQLKLPQLPLPEYSNTDGENLHDFFQNFENIMDKCALSNYEKFLCLMKALSKEPLDLIKSLQGSQQSYVEAKQLLIKAFASPMRQKHEAIKRLVNLSLPPNGEIYSYISKLRIIIQTFNNINMEVKDILQYFIWHSMPKSLQNQFVHITNTNNPQLAQIEEHLFEAAERFSDIKKSSNANKVSNISKSTTNGSKLETVGLAANISDSKSKPKYCSLCSASNKPKEHPIYKCPNFPSPKSKLDKLKSPSKGDCNSPRPQGVTIWAWTPTGVYSGLIALTSAIALKP